ncbi:MAG TPA: FkbM family methyltransferase [Bacteroidales bacterium]|nr:FkbM family methyltransferase [Bacteroidales bacterium]HQN16556.1 FkbM family methyltransferase [Bacteroidales bacterium]
MIKKIWRKSFFKKYLLNLIDTRIEVFEKKNKVKNYEKSNNNGYNLIDISVKAHLAKINGPLICIDVGAHRGDFIKELSTCVELEKAILIEPIPEMVEILKEKFANKNYLIFQNVISDIDKSEKDFLINEMPATSSLFEFNKEMEELNNINTNVKNKQKVITRTMDSIVLESKLKKIDILKIDVQGAEHLVINGAKETLKKTKFAYIELSFKPLYKGSSVFHEIYKLMENLGFIMVEISPGYRSSLNEILQVDAFFVNKSLLLN